MLSKRNLLILIPAILLIPILLGMTPLNMAHKLATGGPLAHGKQICLNNHCPFHSLISHDDPMIVNLNLATLDQEITHIFDIHILDLDSIHSSVTFDSIPLRC
jgi:hypothetical protein